MRRDAVYIGRPTARRLLPDLLRTMRRGAVTDKLFSVATRSGQIGRLIPTIHFVESRHAGMTAARFVAELDYSFALH